MRTHTKIPGTERSPETAFYSKVNLFLSEKYNLLQIKSDWYFFLSEAVGSVSSQNAADSHSWALAFFCFRYPFLQEKCSKMKRKQN